MPTTGISVTTGTNNHIIISGNMIYDAKVEASIGISLANCSYVKIIDNCVDYCATSISVAATASDCTVKGNLLTNAATIRFVDAGARTEIHSVIVSFVGGTDPQDSGFLVDSTNGGDDYARTYMALPVGVQQVMRMKVYARSTATETHSMEADFTIYAGAGNQVYTIINGSAASLASTSVNFAADDVIYWTLTNAGILAFLAQDSIQVKVDYAVADGDNCATGAYFRTVEIEYV